MSKSAEQVSGVKTTNKPPAPPEPMTDPTFENKKLSREQYIEKYDKIAKAKEAGKKAEAAALEAAGINSDGTIGKGSAAKASSTPQMEAEKNLQRLRGELADIESQIKADPKNLALKKKKNKIAEELDRAEEAGE